MTYFILAFEFFKIGLLAIGGGLVTIPFLFDLSEKYEWFSVSDLTDMIAISESTPGPLGVNMATFVGYDVMGVMGGILATISLVAPSVIIISFMAKFLKKYSCDIRVHYILETIRPAVLALILLAGYSVAQTAITNVKELVIFLAFFVTIHFFKRSPIFYIFAAAIVGIFCS